MNPIVPIDTQAWSATHLAELDAARRTLRSPGFLIRASTALGEQLGSGMSLLPSFVQGRVQSLTRIALRTAVRAATWSVRRRATTPSRDRLHRVAVSLSGGAGGAFGLPALAIELPLTTTLMLRSIAEIARAEGEDLSRPEARLACLEVFALGATGAGGARLRGAAPNDVNDGGPADGGYYGVRLALAAAMREAIGAASGLGGIGILAPAVTRFLSGIASRFGVQVSQKLVLQAAPLVGAAGGVAINNLFLDHYQKIARAHFTIRRLERVYGPDRVRQVFESKA
ncbi:MAG: EcsC family protein [Lautropia sp.]